MADRLPIAAQAEHLTDVLRRAGVLPDGVVQEVAVESSRPTIVSRIIRLRLTYDRPNAPAPASLILKTGLPDRANHGCDAVRNEIAFYTQVTSAMPTLPVLRCYDADLNEAAKEWHLLLEDLTDTHFVLSPWPLPPTAEQCEHMIEVRARFHAAWWGDPRLGTTIGTWRDQTAIDQYLKRLADAVANFSDRLGDHLSAERQNLYDQLLAAAPRLYAHYRKRERATVVQGDAHPWNCFLPRDGGADVRLFDWDAWRLDLGASDLAHMMAVPDFIPRAHNRIPAIDHLLVHPGG